MKTLFNSYLKFVERIADPMMISGAFVGGWSGMYYAHEDESNNMAKTWFGGVLGAGVGTLTGFAMAYTFPVAIIAGGVKLYDNVKVPILK
jgi:hypothetical protein